MTEAQLDIQDIKDFKPKTIGDIKHLGFKVKLLPTDGLYRDVYRIAGRPLVVKVPKDEEQPSLEDNINHSKAEWKAVKRIKRFKKFETLKRYMPEIYYFNEKTGLMVMKYYPKIKKYSHMVSRLLEEIVDLTWPYAVSGESVDMHGENVAYDEETDTPVIIDLGYFSASGKGEMSW